MTISTTSNEVVAQGNGLTTSFDFSFPIPLASELFVYYTDSTGAITLIPSSQYTVTGIGTANGGAVTYPLSGSPIATGTSLTIQRVVPYVQLTDLVNQSGYYPNVVENALDYLTMQTQQLAEQTALSLQVPFSATPANLVFPTAAGRAGKLAGFDSAGNAVAYPISASVGAGNLTSEGPFVSGVNFTPNVTTSLTLSQAYGSTANVQVHFDAEYQGPDQYSLNGAQITFTSPIPAGVQKVYIVGGTTLSVNTPGNGSVGTVQIQDGAVTDKKLDPASVVSVITQNIWTLKRFGAKMDGVTDDTQAVIRAVQSGEKLIIADQGDCVLDGTVNITVDLGFALRGASRRGTRFLIQNANQPAFKVADALTGIELSNFTISRVPTAISGANGIQWTGSNSLGMLSNILVENCWTGFDLGPTDYSKILNCIAQQNFNHGFYFSNAIGNGACQWTLDMCLSGQNNGSGLFIDGTSGGSGGISLGDITNFSTFANNGNGIRAAGTVGNPINGLRLLGGFIGSDNTDAIFMDTFGGQHKLIGVELELAGQNTAGRNLSIAASHAGHGINITANNVRVQISAPNINGISNSGIVTAATATPIDNPHIANCGLAGVPSDQNGVIASNRVTIVGGQITGNVFGVSGAPGSLINITGTDLGGNTTAPTVGSATFSLSNCLT